MDNRNAVSNALQNMIDEIMNENLFNSSRTNTNYNNNNRRNFYENENSAIIQLLREIVHSYDENMREYSDNMQHILQIISAVIQRQQHSRNNYDPLYEYAIPNSNNIRNNTSTREPNARRSARQSSRTTRNTRTAYQTNTPIMSYYFYYDRDLSGNISNQTGFQDVIVAPTREQIDSATRTITYSENIELLNHRCPISLADFEEGDEIIQIIHCGHCFCEETIQGWFRTNVRCPICRYDIREYSNQETEANTERQHREQSRRSVNDNMQNMQNITNNMFGGLTNSLANILNNYLENEVDVSNNLTYTFEMPIIFSDISNNRI
jgi:hypothetical protein